jgi:hypothetical protein
MTRTGTRRGSLSIVALLLGVAGCTKEESLVLLDLRPSGRLGAPVARIRLSAKGWPKRTVDGTLDVAGFRVGYYGPGDGDAVTVSAEALDAVDCVLGSGSATVPALKAGATSAPTTLFVRPQPGNACVPDAGTDGGGEEAGTDGGGTDAGEDVGIDGGDDGGDDTESDAAIDASVDRAEDAGTGATADGGAPDAKLPDGGSRDDDDDASVADAAVD